MDSCGLVLVTQTWFHSCYTCSPHPTQPDFFYGTPVGRVQAVLRIGLIRWPKSTFAGGGVWELWTGLWTAAQKMQKWLLRIKQKKLWCIHLFWSKVHGLLTFPLVLMWDFVDHFSQIWFRNISSPELPWFVIIRFVSILNDQMVITFPSA